MARYTSISIKLDDDAKKDETIEVNLADVLSQVNAREVLKEMSGQDFVDEIPLNDFITHYGEDALFKEVYTDTLLKQNIMEDEIVALYGAKVLIEHIPSEVIFEYLDKFMDKADLLLTICELLKHKEKE